MVIASRHKAAKMNKTVFKIRNVTNFHDHYHVHIYSPEGWNNFWIACIVGYTLLSVSLIVIGMLSGYVYKRRNRARGGADNIALY